MANDNGNNFRSGQLNQSGGHPVRQTQAYPYRDAQPQGVQGSASSQGNAHTGASAAPNAARMPGAVNGPRVHPQDVQAAQTAQSKKGSSKRTILIVLGVIVAALAIWVLVWLFACNGNSLLDPSAQTGQAPYKSAEEVQAELDRVVEDGMFNISIASVIQFEDGTSSGTAYIENVPGNRYNMQVTITDDDTGNVLYESGVLKPNQFIESITLTEDLDAGSHDATATFKALDPTNYDEMGTAAAKVTISVLN